MSTILSVNLHFEQRTAKRGKDSSESSRIYKVLFDSAGGTPEEAEVADDGTTRIPQYGAALSTNAARVVDQVSAAPMRDSKRLFLVTVRYVQKLDEEGGGGGQDPNPINRSPKIRWGTNKYQRVIEKDINGAPLRNSAGEKFDPPPMETKSIPVVTITMNLPTFDPDIHMPLIDSLNIAIQTIAGRNNIAAGGAKMEDIRHTRRIENNITYQQVTFRIEVAGSYQIDLLDQGWHRLPDGGAETAHYLGNGVFEKIPITNADGRTPRGPVLLDGAGQPLANGDPPVFLAFDVIEKKSWSALNLPEEL